MTVIEAMTQDLRDDGIITGLKHWAKGNHERTYIAAAGHDRKWRGCSTHQLYWDHKACKLISNWGRGTAPHDYHEAVDKIVEAFAE
jgi:hypothetical protein